jgi:hypothetical protein
MDEHKSNQWPVLFCGWNNGNNPIINFIRNQTEGNINLQIDFVEEFMRRIENKIKSVESSGSSVYVMRKERSDSVETYKTVVVLKNLHNNREYLRNELFALKCAWKKEKLEFRSKPYEINESGTEIYVYDKDLEKRVTFEVSKRDGVALKYIINNPKHAEKEKIIDNIIEYEKRKNESKYIKNYPSDWEERFLDDYQRLYSKHISDLITSPGGKKFYKKYVDFHHGYKTLKNI